MKTVMVGTTKRVSDPFSQEDRLRDVVCSDPANKRSGHKKKKNEFTWSGFLRLIIHGFSKETKNPVFLIGFFQRDVL